MQISKIKYQNYKSKIKNVGPEVDSSGLQNWCRVILIFAF